MDISRYAAALFGGMLIGISASLLLLLKGRIFGVSGILAGVLIPKTQDTAWRIAALVGLLTAGVILASVLPKSMPVSNSNGVARYIIAGLLVGLGTQLGNGCTSGHGVCGISRMSLRSLTATLIFIAAGIMVVALLRTLGGLT